MTLVITTQSHGQIEAGYFGSYTAGFRFGEFAFPTRAVIRMVQHFAEKSSSLAVNLPSFGEEVFWKRASTNLSLICDRLFEMNDSLFPELKRNELEAELRSLDSGIFGERERPAFVVAPIRISDDEKIISLADYKIDRDEYQFLAGYSLRGGWFGWPDKKFPEEALDAIAAVRKCRRPLYLDFPFDMVDAIKK